MVYDPVGGAFTEQALRDMAWNGRLLVVGFATGDIPKIPIKPGVAEELFDHRGVLARVHEERAGNSRATMRNSPTVPCGQGDAASACHLPAGARSRGADEVLSQRSSGKVVLVP